MKFPGQTRTVEALFHLNRTSRYSLNRLLDSYRNIEVIHSQDIWD